MNLDKITQQYIDLFPGDLSGNLQQRQTPGVIFSTVETEHFANAQLLHFNGELAHEIGLGQITNAEDEYFLNAKIQHLNLKTYATAYAGHQFGNWAGQLGDGRAILAGEIRNAAGTSTELQWKGAGATPYSRHADGRAVLRSTVREYLMSEAMHHLGIPTTRSLSISLTGEDVIRDIMYSGNPRPEKGALMMRTAESFLRFGHFELLSAQRNMELLSRLADFTIENYFPDIQASGKDKYLEWFKTVSERTADLVVEWMRVGFVHGVMNTDNMSILGLTIDYGPFAMLEDYDLNFTSNTTDLPGRRYAFGQQGKMAQWNLWQLANALFPLINDAEALQDVLNHFGDDFWQKHDAMLGRKFGFGHLQEDDEAFFTEWQHQMQDLKLDYTLFFQKLEYFENIDLADFKEITYGNADEATFQKLKAFLEQYSDRLRKNTITREESRKMMAAANPKFILRNYMLFECIERLDRGDRSMFDQLLSALKVPFEALYPEFNQKRPEKYNDVAGCSMLSCSS